MTGNYFCAAADAVLFRAGRPQQIWQDMILKLESMQLIKTMQIKNNIFVQK